MTSTTSDTQGGPNTKRFHHYPKEQLREVLVSVRDDLRSGVIPENKFNMDTAVLETDCGTIACIGGHAALRLGMSGDEAIRAVEEVWPSWWTRADDPTVDDDLYWLFYKNLESNDVELAADRIDEYLRRIA